MKQLADTARGRLSPMAISEVKRQGIVRDPEWTTTGEVLAAKLNSLRIPVRDSVLSIERDVGGALLHGKAKLGLYASLRKLDGVRRPKGTRLPLVVGIDPEVWLAHDDSVWFVNTDDDYGYAERAFAHFDAYLEHVAFLHESLVWPPEHEQPSGHRLFLNAHVGAALAEELGGWALHPDSIWMRDEMHIVELNIPGFVVGTHVGTVDGDDAIEVLRAALAHKIDVEWSSPSSVAPALLRSAAVPPQVSTTEQAGCLIYMWGGVPRYNFDMKRMHAKNRATP